MKADAELIAKVLDGRATADERARVLAEADESPELLELLADSAAAIGQETGIEKRESEIARRRFARPRVLSIGGALLAAAAGVFFLWPRGGISAPPFPVAMTLTDLGPARAGAALSAVRGSTDGDRLLQSVIVGSRLADLQVLGADTSRETAALEIAHALRAIPGGEVAAASFSNGSVITPGVVEAVESVVDRRAFRAAEWLELIRLAAVGRDRFALSRSDVARAVEAMATDRGLSPSVRESAVRIQAQLGPAGDLSVVAEMAGQGLAALAGRR